MKTTLHLIILLFASYSLAGQSATIEQMKNKKAIVRFDDDINFRLGQKVTVSSLEGADFTFGKESRNLLEKRNSITFTSGITSMTTKTDSGGTVRTSSFDFSVKYGINKGIHEYGPIFSFSNEKDGSGTTTSYNIGAFYEHYFVPNTSENEKVHGLFGDVSVGSIKDSDDTISPTTINFGGFYKWFYLSPVLAFRFDLGYRYITYSEATSSGFVFGAGLNHYF